MNSQYLLSSTDYKPVVNDKGRKIYNIKNPLSKALCNLYKLDAIITGKILHVETKIHYRATSLGKQITK